MKTVILADPVRYPRMTTEELRSTFLLDGLYEPGKLHLNYVELERAIVGFAAPARSRPRPPYRSRSPRRTTSPSAASSARSTSAASASSLSRARATS